jgi:hypothetical protein
LPEMRRAPSEREDLVARQRARGAGEDLAMTISVNTVQELIDAHYAITI